MDSRNAAHMADSLRFPGAGILDGDDASRLPPLPLPDLILSLAQDPDRFRRNLEEMRRRAAGPGGGRESPASPRL